MESNLQTSKEGLLREIDRRVEDMILEKSNADLLKKLIRSADSLTEAIAIAELGTTYKRTGLHFDKRLERMTSSIQYFKKNAGLSFCTDKNAPINKLIIGDNYPSLLNLLIEFRGKIDVIYIDPPYGKDKMGEFAQTNYDNAISRDNLLSMLYPRLQLSKQLLADGGVIFTSIDDRNYAYVKCLYDEVFGEKCFLATYLWKKTDTPPSLSNKVRKKYEYVLCYGKRVCKSHKFSQGQTDGDDAPLLNTGNPKKEVEFPAGSVRFYIQDGNYQPSADKKIILTTPVVVENGVNKEPFRAIGTWKWAQAKINEEVKNGTYFIIKSRLFSIRYQRNNEDTIKIPQNNLDSQLGVGTNEDGDRELKNILGPNKFDNPKPVSLVRNVGNHSC